jgi:hypothetical protein
LPNPPHVMEFFLFAFGSQCLLQDNVDKCDSQIIDQDKLKINCEELTHSTEPWKE